MSPFPGRWDDDRITDQYIELFERVAQKRSARRIAGPVQED
jgi:hypothetical protein